MLSIFAIIILSILGLVYKNGHEEFVGGIDDPEDGSAVASTIFVAVFVYIVSRIIPPIYNALWLMVVGYRASWSAVASKAFCTCERVDEARSRCRGACITEETIRRSGLFRAFTLRIRPGKRLGTPFNEAQGWIS